MKAKITLRNIYAVLQAFFRKARRNVGGFDLQPYMYEQIIWRRTQVIEKSPECWKSGSCIVCGCDILGKTMEDRQCSSETPCYPEMMNKENWKKYKELYNIKLFN
jgi:hypothetical protein